MKKNTMNFLVDILIFIDFIAAVFTGVLLREFPVDLIGFTVLGVPRKELADLHWVLSLSMIIFILAHLVLHWSWAKASCKKYLQVGPKAIAVTAIAIALISIVLAPVYLTKDLPSREDIKVAHLKASHSSESLALVKDNVGNSDTTDILFDVK